MLEECKSARVAPLCLGACLSCGASVWLGRPGPPGAISRFLLARKTSARAMKVFARACAGSRLLFARELFFR